MTKPNTRFQFKHGDNYHLERKKQGFHTEKIKNQPIRMNMNSLNKRLDVQKQFSTRASTFDQSARWITDEQLIKAHPQELSRPGKGLELCCGTGAVGRAFVHLGWQMTGVDITEAMVHETQKYFPAIQHNVEEGLPFKDETFDAVVMRQALFFFQPEKLLAEIQRVLKKGGRFVLSQTVPYESPEDEAWLKKVHTTKQAQLLNFYTAKDLEDILQSAGFKIEKKRSLTVRENITNWMHHAPELSSEKKNEVMNLIRQTPKMLQPYRNVTEVNGVLEENWNWVIYTTTGKA